MWIRWQSMCNTIMSNLFMVEACAMDAIMNVNKEQGVRQEELQSDYVKEKTKKTPHLLQKIKRPILGEKVSWELASKAQLMVDDELVEVNEDNIDEVVDNDWDY